MVNGRLKGAAGTLWANAAIKPPFTKNKAWQLDRGGGGTIFLNSLLVFMAANIAVGVNHSGDSGGHAIPLGRREE
jgi:hypothetical protein